MRRDVHDMQNSAPLSKAADSMPERFKRWKATGAFPLTERLVISSSARLFAEHNTTARFIRVWN